MSDDAITEVANMIKAKGGNRSQRKRLERALNKMSNIYSQTQSRVDRTAFKYYQEACDEHMLRFFSVLGIVLKKECGYDEEEGTDEIANIFELINTYLVEYQDLSTTDVSKICEEVTEIKLIAE